jgi:hypothetical protein
MIGSYSIAYFGVGRLIKRASVGWRKLPVSLLSVVLKSYRWSTPTLFKKKNTWRLCDRNGQKCNFSHENTLLCEKKIKSQIVDIG